ncbi:hypothetical protein LJR098_001085 [Rhizobium sp. LjRoot98]|uniref:hypothetical protein n=1 Tax=Rhizobium sp. LjRoot98 TaxID=3342345 RepID=UPI003ECEC6BF
MTDYRNNYEPVVLLGKGSLTDRFVRVRGGVWTATHHKQEYLVFADTLRFRQDDQPHPLDVREMVVVSHEELEGSDEQVSLTIEVKA